MKNRRPHNVIQQDYVNRQKEKGKRRFDRLVTQDEFLKLDAYLKLLRSV